MEFLVTMTTHVPDGTPEQAVEDIRAREAARARELATQGHLLRLWRPPLRPGEWRTLGLFAAPDGGRLEEVLASMPLRIWRTDEVTPLSPHPSDPGHVGGATTATSSTADNEKILRGILDEWKAAVDAHQPERAASCFAEDAIFQGLHPYTVGRRGIADYYGSQPLGMTADYRILETRQLVDGVVLGYTSVDFSFTDRPTLTVNLSLVVKRAADRWYISHYQVSKLG
ncbi:muconolactone delta-isomerase [Streptomyces sp. 1114.5]|nr:muconolactone delta-isomerase [Streptomyces sp. 1114.5]